MSVRKIFYVSLAFAVTVIALMVRKGLESNAEEKAQYEADLIAAQMPEPKPTVALVAPIRLAVPTLTPSLFKDFEQQAAYISESVVFNTDSGIQRYSEGQVCRVIEKQGINILVDIDGKSVLIPESKLSTIPPVQKRSLASSGWGDISISGSSTGYDWRKSAAGVNRAFCYRYAQSMQSKYPGITGEYFYKGISNYYSWGDEVMNTSVNEICDTLTSDYWSR